MRKLILFLVTLFIADLTVMAGRVSEAEALQKAQQFMQGKNFVQKQLRRAPSLDASKNAYHVFNAENRQFYGLEHLWRDGKQVDLTGILNEKE
jgi:ribosomal silencing factor RsfS